MSENKQAGTIDNDSNSNNPTSAPIIVDYFKKFGNKYLEQWIKPQVQEFLKDWIKQILDDEAQQKEFLKKFDGFLGQFLAEKTLDRFLMIDMSPLNPNLKETLYEALQKWKDPIKSSLTTLISSNNQEFEFERENKRIKVRSISADPEWTTPEPIQYPNFTTAGNFVEINHLKSSGLSSNEQSPTEFFVRQEWKTFFETLSGEWKVDNESTVRCHLMGPPGTGKSSFVWGFVCWASSTKGKKIRWLKFFSEADGGMQEAYLDGSMISSRTWKASSEFRWSLLGAADLIVIDGYTKNTKVGLSRKEPVLYVSSMQISFNSESVQFRNPLVLWSLGWTLDEFLMACNQDKFFTSVIKLLDAPLLQYFPGDADDEKNSDRTKLLEEKKSKFAPNRNHLEIQQILAKHYYAGASARWMFCFSISKLKSNVNDAIKKINNWESFAAGIVGEASDNVVNTLCTTVPPRAGDSSPQSIYVSKFVTERLSSRANAVFIKDLTKRSNHPSLTSFDEWVLQLDFFMHLKPSATITLVDKDSNKEIKWMVSVEPIEFTIAEELEKPYVVSILKTLKFKHIWFSATKENQPCFDALQIHKYGSNKKNSKTYLLRIIQITRSSTHSVLIGYVQPVIEVLKKIGFPVNKVELYAVIPEGKKEFKFDNWEGGKKSFRDQLRKISTEHAVLFKRANH